MNTGIERDENGTYHWTAAIDGEYDRKIIRIVFGAIGGLCVLFTVYALVKYPDMFLTTLLSCLGVLAVVSAVALPLMRLSRGRQQKYEMNEEYVRFVGYGRSDSYFRYKGIRRVRVNRARNLIHIRGIAVSAPFFVPPEGFEFVRNYILSRLPDSAKVSYEE
jgi:hypothetical protein